MSADGERLTPARLAELLRRQEALQAEAHAVIAELDLPALLARAGRPHLIGSLVYGLMVWRDLDYTVVCPGLTRERFAEVLRPLLMNPRVTALNYRDETGPRSETGLAEDQRHYVVLRYRATSGHEWKIDLSLWTTDAARGEIEHPQRLAARLTHETRAAILWIKDVWHRLPSYPDVVGGYEVYDAVLEHGVRTPTEFDAYLRERGMPTRSEK